MNIAPVSLQLELTYNCNLSCGFCYNQINQERQEPITFKRLKEILREALDYGLFTVNFNGGEPLLYENFFDLVQFCKKIGFDVHCNTNAISITNENVHFFIENFPAICTSLHGYDSMTHGEIVGDSTAFYSTVNAIKMLVSRGCYISVNVVVSKINLHYLNDILELLSGLGVSTLLLSRVLTSTQTFAVSHEEFTEAMSVVKHFQDTNDRRFYRVAFPQPFPLCCCTDSSLFDFIRTCNILCTAGLNTIRINPFGILSPCPILCEPIIGDLKRESFLSVMDKFRKTNWRKKISVVCEDCNDFNYCGGGCLPINYEGVLYDGEY